MSMGAMFGAGVGMAAVESAMDLQNNLITGAVSRYWNRSDAKKAAQLQYRYNKKFNEWLIPYQLSNQYEYAERYAHNTPSWNVSGLRHAGLNPILAASGGFSGGSSPSTSVGSSGSVSAPHTNLSSPRSANVIAAFNGLKQAEVLDAQKDELKSRTAANTLNAETNRMRAEADIRNQTMETDYSVKMKEVETALRTLEIERRKNGNNYDSAQLRDASQVLGHALDSAAQGWDYINNNPSSRSFRDITTRSTRPTEPFHFLRNEHRKHQSLPHETRRQFYDALKQISPLTSYILSPLYPEPSKYSMPRAPRGNTVHNELRKFWREERKREKDLHGWKNQ